MIRAGSACVLPFLLACAVSAAGIENIHIRGQNAPAHIDAEAHTIFIPVGYYGNARVFPLSHAVVEQIKTADGVPGTLPDTLDLRDWTSFKIGDETWKIKGGYQLPASDFGTWHSEQVPGFITFGHTTCDEMAGSPRQRIWDNGKPGFSGSVSKILV